MATVQESWYDGFKARFKYFAELTDPRNMLVPSSEILRARDALKDPGDQISSLSPDSIPQRLWAV